MESENTPTLAPDAEPTGDAPPLTLETLQKELDAAKAKAAENLEGWQRERATFANYKRRVEKEQAETYQSATSRVLARYLDVMDDFDRAMQDRPTAGPEAKWAEGVSLVYRKLQNILEAEGLVAIEGVGQEFDPNQQEAITHEESAEHPAGHVIAIVRKGYKLGEKIVRAALVRVAR